MKTAGYISDFSGDHHERFLCSRRVLTAYRVFDRGSDLIVAGERTLMVAGLAAMGVVVGKALFLRFLVGLFFEPARAMVMLGLPGLHFCMTRETYCTINTRPQHVAASLPCSLSAPRLLVFFTYVLGCNVVHGFTDL